MESAGAGLVGLGEMDLSLLTERAFAAIVQHAEGGEDCRTDTTRLIGTLVDTTRSLVEQTYGEFAAESDWTAERTQHHSLSAIVGREGETIAILSAFGSEILDPLTDLLRKTYFALLTEVKRGASASAGTA